VNRGAVNRSTVNRSTVVLGALLFATSCASSKAKDLQGDADLHAARPYRTVKFNPKALEKLGIKTGPAGGASSEERLQGPGSLD
jgi:hypothetical protein